MFTKKSMYDWFMEILNLILRKKDFLKIIILTFQEKNLLKELITRTDLNA